MVAWNARGATDLAIFFGKRSINILQSLRADLRGLPQELQRSYIGRKQDSYRTLASLLIGEGRLAEDQQILDLLKLREHFDYLRGDATEGPHCDAKACLS